MRFVFLILGLLLITFGLLSLTVFESKTLGICLIVLGLIFSIINFIINIKKIKNK